MQVCIFEFPAPALASELVSMIDTFDPGRTILSSILYYHPWLASQRYVLLAHILLHLKVLAKIAIYSIQTVINVTPECHIVHEFCSMHNNWRKMRIYKSSSFLCGIKVRARKLLRCHAIQRRRLQHLPSINFRYRDLFCSLEKKSVSNSVVVLLLPSE